MIPHGGFDLDFLMISDIEHVSVGQICMSSLETVYSGPLPIFKSFFFLMLNYMSYLYILDINPLSDI